MKSLKEVLLAGFFAVTIVFLPTAGRAQSPPPDCTNCFLLNFWSFWDTNWLSDAGFSPVHFTNVIEVDGNDGNILLLDTTNSTPAFLFYNVVDTNSDSSLFTNLITSAGSISVWFNPDWSSTNQGGSGPGDYANLISLGQGGTNGPWWAWYLSPDGGTVYFASQTNGGPASNYITAPVSFLTTNWYNLVLTYGPTNSAFYTNGVLLTNGTGVAYWPGPDVTFFSIGSDSNGFYQSRGLFSDLQTFNYQLASNDVRSTFGIYSLFYGLASDDTNNTPLIVGAPFTNMVVPVFDAVTGLGFLLTNGTYTPSSPSSNIWITNWSATIVASNVIDLNFAIGGGSNNVAYDVFATAAIAYPITNATWYWMGQSYRGTNYVLPITNSPIGSVFLILGKPQDTDQDGLTDAYELLVNHTDPNKADTSGDGMLDGWKVVWGLNPLTNNAAQTSTRLNYAVDGAGRLYQVSGIQAESIGFDGEGNIFSAH